MAKVIKLYARREVLRWLRGGLGFSQGEFATLISLKREEEITEALYQKIEQGVRGVDIKTAKIICLVTDTRINELFYFKENSKIRFGNQL